MRERTGRKLRWYGAGPLHLVAMVACFAVSAYAAVKVLPSNPVGIAVWFVGAAVAHDLLLLPLYAIADRSVLAVARHRRTPGPTFAWINFVRVPAAVSGVLLLVWFPLILRLPSGYDGITGMTTSPYLARWLLVTGALFVASAVILAVRMRGARAAAP